MTKSKIKDNMQIPWFDMMRCANFMLGIQPKDFWELTMVEFVQLMKFYDYNKNIITRDELNQLIKKFG